ncbi:MAG: 50S ribosomal protein L17 [Elusimicrobiota bacterium]
MIKTHARRKLGVRQAHRRSMLRSLATHLLHHEKITTTTARAKELKAYTDRLVSRLKSIEDPLRRTREVSRWLAPNGFEVDKKLLQIILPRYQARQGGVVRVIGLPPRLSDQAALSRVELVA